MQTPSLTEGLDYYIENGRWVFTAHYLRARGYCCGNCCRHCPYKGTESSEYTEAEKKSIKKCEKEERNFFFQTK